MRNNILNKVSQHMDYAWTESRMRQEMEEFLTNIDAVYSYLVYAKYSDDKLTGWIVEYNLSQTDDYNTLKKEYVINHVLKDIFANKNVVQHVVGFKQPPLETMLQLYEPLVQKLALEQCRRWNVLEYEDACSMCRLTFVNLYKKGYYIHKRLLSRAFNNEVLMSIRSERCKPDLLSLEQTLYSDGDNGRITVADCIPDKVASQREQDLEDSELNAQVFKRVKEILIGLFGERQFEQLLRDYGNKHTTTWSRKKMQQVKDKFKRMGITRQRIVEEENL